MEKGLLDNEKYLTENKTEGCDKAGVLGREALVTGWEGGPF